MPAREHEFSRARAQILKDTFPSVTPEQAVVLVGILFENRIVLSIETWNPATQTSLQRVVELPPLDPQAASSLVAGVFDLDSDRLFLRFQRAWGSLKQSLSAKELKAAILSHDWVASLEEHWPLV